MTILVIRAVFLTALIGLSWWADDTWPKYGWGIGWMTAFAWYGFLSPVFAALDDETKKRAANEAGRSAQ